MAQLRSGILPLEIETGRFRNVQVDNRFCFHCKTIVEDELHFVLSCPLYREARQQLMDHVVVVHDRIEHSHNMEKMKIILNVFWKMSSKFLSKAWEVRSKNILLGTV